METWWLSDDEVVLDPTRLTLFVGNAGIEGARCRRFPANETHCIALCR
jgi:arginine/lysine/ornithine decarboxylase